MILNRINRLIQTYKKYSLRYQIKIALKLSQKRTQRLSLQLSLSRKLSIIILRISKLTNILVQALVSLILYYLLVVLLRRLLIYLSTYQTSKTFSILRKLLSSQIKRSLSILLKQLDYLLLASYIIYQSLSLRHFVIILKMPLGRNRLDTLLAQQVLLSSLYLRRIVAYSYILIIID